MSHFVFAETLFSVFSCRPNSQSNVFSVFSMEQQQHSVAPSKSSKSSKSYIPYLVLHFITRVYRARPTREPQKSSGCQAFSTAARCSPLITAHYSPRQLTVHLAGDLLATRVVHRFARVGCLGCLDCATHLNKPRARPRFLLFAFWKWQCKTNGQCAKYERSSSTE